MATDSAVMQAVRQCLSDMIQAFVTQGILTQVKADNIKAVIASA